jgi:hypothetical protein
MVTTTTMVVTNVGKDDNGNEDDGVDNDGDDVIRTHDQKGRRSLLPSLRFLSFFLS